MPLTFEGIENGAKKFRDLETGEKLFSEETLDNTLNTFGETIEDRDLITSKLGETVFEDANAAAGALTSITGGAGDDTFTVVAADLDPLGTIDGGDYDTGKEPTLERATEKSGVLITFEWRSREADPAWKTT